MYSEQKYAEPLVDGGEVENKASVQVEIDIVQVVE